MLERLPLPDGSTIETSGTPMVFGAMLRSVLHDGPRATLISLLLVASLIAVLVRPARSAAIAVATLCLGVLWMVGAAGLARVHVTFLNFLALPITFGVGGEYAINVVARWRREGSAVRAVRVGRRRGVAVLVDDHRRLRLAAGGAQPGAARLRRHGGARRDRLPAGGGRGDAGLPVAVREVRTAVIDRLARGFGGGDRARAAIRIGFLALSLAAIAWDLPSSFSWENDGVAPRDIFAGVAQNLHPGTAFRYPLLHPLLLGVLCLPVLLPAALRAPSFRLADLQPAILATPVMTACALIGRAVAIAAALVALAALGRIATRLAGRRVALWAEAFAAANFSFAYYGRATNLDGPALMWTALSVERLLRAGEDGDARDSTVGAVFAALAVATKDQSYATFVLLLPLVLIGFARRA